jgi:hypothetical protein
MPPVTAAALPALAIIEASVGLMQWAKYAVEQSVVLALVAPVVSQAGPNDTVLVLGSSGTLGDVYTFLPPHLWYASEVECCKPTQIDLCTVDGTVRIHPVAAQFPLGSTQYCSELVLHGTAKVISSELISGKDVSVALDSPCGPKLPSDGLGGR